MAELHKTQCPDSLDKDTLCVTPYLLLLPWATTVTQHQLCVCSVCVCVCSVRVCVSRPSLPVFDTKQRAENVHPGEQAEEKERTDCGMLLLT